MKWLKKLIKRSAASLPEVPDDLEERRQALEESRMRLAEAEALRERSKASSAELRESNQVNHYIRRLELSYVQGGRRAG